MTFGCLKELGSARDMDFKRLLQLVQSYSDDVQALLEAGQAAALHQQQEYMQQLTADAAAAVGGSIETALAAAHKAHQQQVGRATTLESALVLIKRHMKQCIASHAVQQLQASICLVTAAVSTFEQQGQIC
jgi:hypothetical protein